MSKQKASGKAKTKKTSVVKNKKVSRKKTTTKTKASKQSDITKASLRAEVEGDKKVKKTDSSIEKMNESLQPDPGPKAEVNQDDRPTSEIAAAEPAASVSLQESKKFWMLFIAAGILGLLIIQAYGYLTGWGDPKKVIERHFNQAQHMTLAKRYQAAIKQYQKVMSMKAANEESKRQALVGIADLYRENHEWDNAIAAYRQLQQDERETVMAAWSGLKIAECQLANGQSEKSLATYLQISQLFPNTDWDAEARLGQGQALVALKKYDQAVEIYQSLEKQYKGGFLAADAMIQIGRCYEIQGKDEKAKEAYRYVIKAYPEAMADEAKQRLKRLSSNRRPLGIRQWEN